MTMRAAAETTAKMMGQEGVHLTINKVLRWWIAEDGGWGERKRWCGDCGDGRTTPTTKAVASSKHANDICAVVGSLSSAVLSDRGGGRMLAIVQNPGEGGGGVATTTSIKVLCPQQRRALQLDVLREGWCRRAEGAPRAVGAAHEPHADGPPPRGKGAEEHVVRRPRGGGGDNLQRR